jgi:hypothetical protein
VIRARGSMGKVTSDTSQSATCTSTRSRPLSSGRAFSVRKPMDRPSSAPARTRAAASRAWGDTSTIRPRTNRPEESSATSSQTPIGVRASCW